MQFALRSADGQRFALVLGSNIVGRGATFGVLDKRCSRKQLEITVTLKHATALVHGVNPSFLIRKGSESHTRAERCWCEC
jgi:hypothetical protein